MIRSSPCDHYLKYLITHPDTYKDSSIRSLIKLQQLDFLGMAHLGRLRASCTPPNPFYPEDLQHHESQRFLTKERIYYLYHPDDDTIIAIKLLDHPRGKELVESILSAGGDPLWACTMLKRVNFKATPRSIDLYRHFYFNTDLVNNTELRAILGMRAVYESGSSDPDERSYRFAYNRAARSNVTSLMASAPSSPFAHVLNLMRLGMMPTGLELSRVATVARMAATVRSMESTMLGQAEKARDFALTAKILNELMESVGDVSGDLQRSMMNLALDTDASEVPSIAQLTEGNHTVDMIPVIETEAQESVVGGQVE